MVCHGTDYPNYIRSIELEEKKMKKHISKYYILLLLALMFAAPGVTAYFFYNHPSWLGTSKVNKGILLNPPSVLSALDDKAKWRIVFWSPDVCDKACITQLDVLARVRLALGRKLYHVDQWLILGDKASSLSEATAALLKEQDFHVTQLSSAEMKKMTALSAQSNVYLANPDKYLILSYQSQVNPEDIYKDLKLLLNTSEKKSG